MIEKENHELRKELSKYSGVSPSAVKPGQVRNYKLAFVCIRNYFNAVLNSDVQYISIYRNDIFIQYRDTLLAFGCIDTLEWTV